MLAVDVMVPCFWSAPTCRLDWAGVAAVASTLAVVVAGVSAYAVFRLGRQANRLAKIALDSAADERNERLRLDALRAAREERTILAHVFAELDAMVGTFGALANTTGPGQSGDLPVVARRTEVRARLLEKSKELITSRIDSMVPMLARISPEIGLRLARLAGDCALIKQKLEQLARYPVVDVSDPSADQAHVRMVTASFGAYRVLVVRAAEDHKILFGMAIDATRVLEETG